MFWAFSRKVGAGEREEPIFRDAQKWGGRAEFEVRDVVEQKVCPQGGSLFPSASTRIKP